MKESCVKSDRTEKKMEEVEYGVTQIIATRRVGGKLEVLVQWEATWEPLSPVIVKGRLWQEFLEENEIVSDEEERSVVNEEKSEETETSVADEAKIERDAQPEVPKKDVGEKRAEEARVPVSRKRCARTK